ncbi:hypothetical protein BD770DRAFT_375691 [Pilaira anomala]|nr:hypothetical protein BD770DRAFT_375691 [Pilaira anomala]
MTSTDILELKLNDSSLDLLNEAIKSHLVEQDDKHLLENSSKDETSVSHVKRTLDKDEETSTTIPKRAGRKPLDKSQTAEASLDPKQKRKAQNRAAQRAFRDRKEKHVAELQARIEELERMNATKDSDLLKENEQLKEMLKKLQEENYALKGAKFTFEYPVHHHPTDIKKHEYTTSSSMSSYSGGEETNPPLSSSSPLSNSHEDDSTSADTPPVLTTEPMQFGLIQPMVDHHHHHQQQQQVNSFLPDANVDLFHGKDDLFTDYRVPPITNNSNQDFLFANEDLSSLFGGNNELFGFNNNQFAVDQFGLSNTTGSGVDKQQLVDTLRKCREEGKHVSQVHQEIQQQCPTFDLDLLCDELKRKATCNMNQYPLTDYDVDAFVKCLDRV